MNCTDTQQTLTDYMGTVAFQLVFTLSASAVGNSM